MSNFSLRWTADYNYAGFFDDETLLKGHVDSDVSKEDSLDVMTISMAQYRTRTVNKDGRDWTVWSGEEVSWGSEIGIDLDKNDFESAMKAVVFINAELVSQKIPIHLSNENNEWIISIKGDKNVL